MGFKHTLPVNTTCANAHGGSLTITRDQVKGIPGDPPCTFADGTHATDNIDLWRCMHEANCDITDDCIQMAVFRDPRPAIVSTFYHVEVRPQRELGDLEAFVAKKWPILCQWLAVRYILFSGILADQSIEYWYADAMDDLLGWHYHWLHSIGVQLPLHVAKAMADAAAADDLGSEHNPVDLHPGEGGRTDPGKVLWFEDEVSQEILEICDDVLRTWLPPVLLERFGVAP